MLESTIGRLNHAAFVIPLARHFLNRLRLRLRKRQFASQQLTLSKQELQDFELWLQFLRRARTGLSMNLLTLRKPSRLAFSDSCPYGLGGFTWSGRAWRLKVPESSPLHGDSTANNFLEFLAMAVTIWLVVKECEEEGAKEECILALGDNTSAIGWLHRSGRLSPESVYYEAVNLVARKVASLVTKSENCLFSQHIRGEKNVVSDLLSYTGSSRGNSHPLAPEPDISDQELTRRFHSSLPQIIPENFNICPLPSDVSSFVTLAVQTAESSWIRSKKGRTRAATECGVDGHGSVPPSTLSTHSSMTYPAQSRNSCYVPSLSASESLSGITTEAFLESVRSPWSRRLSEVPQALWLRRSGTISNSAPFTSKGATSSCPR